MIELEPVGIGEHGLQIGRIERAVGRETDEMLVAAPVGYLDQAEPVAAQLQPHGFGVDGNRAGGEHAFGQVFFMEVYAHFFRIGPSG